MRAFRRLCLGAALALIILTVLIDAAVLRQGNEAEGTYRVEAKRLADQIEETGTYRLEDFPHLTGVYTGEGSELYQSDEPYVIIEAGGKLYRVEYRVVRRQRLLEVNLLMGTAALLTAGLLWYIYRHIIVPFGRLGDVPRELAKGNLSVPIPEEKSRFFGKFTWGVNLLRESIEDSRRRELGLQRDKKLLLLSLSHDIKTPLSAIKLNASALARGLYKDEDKRREAALSINARADEIERFVSEITKAASEDFLSFEVNMGEAFLDSVIGRIEARYGPQLALSGTELRVERFDNCLLKCDPDRLGECVQNLVENAIKYGDGRLIGLGFERMDGCELITVYNTGCTLEDKELVSVFDSFHRGSNAEKVPGNGLGLFICKRLMSLMDGEVFAEIRDGCFRVTLVVKLA